MFPLMPLLGVGADLLGGFLGKAGQDDANAANAKQAQMNRDFQERMSNTAWQRGVADMKAAGLNPALAYERGGASAPQGMSATMQNANASLAGSASRVGEQLRSGQLAAAQIQATSAQADKTRVEANQIRLESALQVAALAAQLEATKVGTALTAQKRETEVRETALRDSQRHNVQADTLLKGQRYDQAQLMNPLEMTAQILANMERGGMLDANIGIRNAMLQGLRYGLPQARNASNFAETWFGKYIAPALGSAGSITSMFRDIK